MQQEGSGFDSSLESHSRTVFSLSYPCGEMQGILVTGTMECFEEQLPPGDVLSKVLKVSTGFHLDSQRKKELGRKGHKIQEFIIVEEVIDRQVFEMQNMYIGSCFINHELMMTQNLDEACLS